MTIKKFTASQPDSRHPQWLPTYDRREREDQHGGAWPPVQQPQWGVRTGHLSADLSQDAGHHQRPDDTTPVIVLLLPLRRPVSADDSKASSRIDQGTGPRPGVYGRSGRHSATSVERLSRVATPVRSLPRGRD